MPTFAVILPAGGSSTRFGSNKLAASLGDCTVFQRTLQLFLRRRDVEQIIVPTATPDLIVSEGDPRVIPCRGGACRAESVRNGLGCIATTVEWVAVHDAARPLATDALIDRTLAAAVERGCAAPALPVALTIKETSAPLPARVRRTVPRHNLFAMQTPQIMRRQALLEAFARCPMPLTDITDDVQLLELAGHEVWLVPGEENNLKITTPLDLLVARAILGER